MNSNLNIKTLWAGTCLPAKAFPIVMAGVVLFNLWRGVWVEAVKNVIVGVIGTSALWLLCTSGMELLAYMVLAVPVIFIIFLLALIVFDQTLLQVTHTYGTHGKHRNQGNQGCNDCNGCDQPTC
jgi:hypothetical protein